MALLRTVFQNSVSSEIREFFIGFQKFYIRNLRVPNVLFINVILSFV